MRQFLLPMLAAVAVAVAATASSGAPRTPRGADEGQACAGITGKACNPGLYCFTEPGVCRTTPGAQGVCRPTPDICSNDVEPVCGCDGKTHDNVCLAEIERTSVAAPGACPSAELQSRRR